MNTRLNFAYLGSLPGTVGFIDLSQPMGPEDAKAGKVKVIDDQSMWTVDQSHHEHHVVAR